MNETSQTPEATSSARMDPYGERAMRHARDHCPNRYSQIPDPIGFFTELGEQIRDQVIATEETIMTPVPGEAFTETLGRARMARLMAEDQVFSEMVYEAMPPETSETDDQPDDWYRDWSAYMTDLNSILQADDQDL